MAAGVKYRVEFYDIFSKRVQVDFLTKDYTGDIKPLIASASPVELAFKGDDDSTWQSIFTSQATIKVLAGIDDVEFFEDIATMEDDTFGVDIRVQRKSGLSLWITEYQWNGWCVPDEQQRTFSYQLQEVTITAICPLSRAKGYSLLDEDGNYIHGKHALSYYINRCIAPAFSEDNTIGSYTVSVSNTMRLSHEPGDTSIPPTFDGIGIDAEAFNDDDGRPINAHDALNKIITGFICRCFYENRTLYIFDIPDLSESTDLSEKNIVYKNAEGADINSDLVLIKNSENITTLRSFKESNCTFKYTGVAGLLIDGNMLDWSDEPDGGHLLNQWQYNSTLSGAGDFTERRVGNGRVESPYGFQLQVLERIGAISSIKLDEFDIFKLSISATYTAFDSVDLSGDNSGLFLDVNVYLYNDNDPSASYKSNGTGDGKRPPIEWVQVDLTGTSFATGVIDFSLVASGESFGVVSLEMQKSGQIQRVELDIIELPQDFTGNMYVVFSPIRAIATSPPPAEGIIFSAILSRNVSSVNKRNYTGEKVYITRDTKVSTQTQSREIELNTSANDSASGALVAMVDYTDFSGIARKANAPINPVTGLTKDVSDTSWGNLLPLIKYNAMAIMRYNYNQLKIDVDVQGANCPFATPLNLSALYDSERPSTAIYNERFLQLNQTYDLKTCQRKMTIASMKINSRALSTVAADETHDLYEYYQTVQQ